MISSVVSTQYINVTDRQTDRLRTSAYRATNMRHAAIDTSAHSKMSS